MNIKWQSPRGRNLHEYKGQFFGVVVVIVCFSLVLGIISYSNINKFLTFSKTEGVIIEDVLVDKTNKKVCDKDPYTRLPGNKNLLCMYRKKIEFTDQGDVKTVITNISESKGGWGRNVGDRVKVMYDIDEPEDAHIIDIAFWLPTSFLFLLVTNLVILLNRACGSQKAKDNLPG